MRGGIDRIDFATTSMLTARTQDRQASESVARIAAEGNGGTYRHGYGPRQSWRVIDAMQRALVCSRSLAAGVAAAYRSQTGRLRDVIEQLQLSFEVIINANIDDDDSECTHRLDDCGPLTNGLSARSIRCGNGDRAMV